MSRKWRSIVMADITIWKCPYCDENFVLPNDDGIPEECPECGKRPIGEKELIVCKKMEVLNGGK